MVAEETTITNVDSINGLPRVSHALKCSMLINASSWIDKSQRWMGFKKFTCLSTSGSSVHVMFSKLFFNRLGWAEWKVLEVMVKAGPLFPTTQVITVFINTWCSEFHWRWFSSGLMFFWRSCNFNFFPIKSASSHRLTKRNGCLSPL